MLLASMIANCLAQLFLWCALWFDIENHHWNDGLWGTFGVGAIFVIIAVWLQVQTLARARKARKGQPPQRLSRQERWLPRLLLWNLLIGAIGNVFDLVWMYHKGVPFGYKDTILTQIAVGSFIAIMSLTYAGVFIRWLGTRKHRREIARLTKSKNKGGFWLRFKFAGGVSTRIIPQLVLGLWALSQGASPMAVLTLVALTLVMGTFAPGFFIQRIVWRQKGYPTAEATVNLYLYGINFIVLAGAVWVAKIMATH